MMRRKRIQTSGPVPEIRALKRFRCEFSCHLPRCLPFAHDLFGAQDFCLSTNRFLVALPTPPSFHDVGAFPVSNNPIPGHSSGQGFCDGVMMHPSSNHRDNFKPFSRADSIEINRKVLCCNSAKNIQYTIIMKGFYNFFNPEYRILFSYLHIFLILSRQSVNFLGIPVLLWTLFLKCLL